MSTGSPRRTWIGSRVMRNRRVDSYLHTASRRIIDLLISEGIGTLVIGKNPLWKQEVRLGKRTNQQFVQLPHARFIEQLTYKAKLVGIEVMREARELHQQGIVPGQRPAAHLSD
jgi:IS605 OrfB family transposase